MRADLIKFPANKLKVWCEFCVISIIFYYIFSPINYRNLRQDFLVTLDFSFMWLIWLKGYFLSPNTSLVLVVNGPLSWWRQSDEKWWVVFKVKRHSKYQFFAPYHVAFYLFSLLKWWTNILNYYFYHHIKFFYFLGKVCFTNFINLFRY